MTPVLSLVIPAQSEDDPLLADLLQSIRKQRFPGKLEVIVETQGHSEAAKAYGIRKAKGEIIGLLCTDNYLIDPNFLSIMTQYAKDPRVIGSYTARYAYVPGDTALSRYFALLGANDPVCWWLGKADRCSYLDADPRTPRCFNGAIPSIGDNGCFVKRRYLADVQPATHFCVDAMEDLRRQGYATYHIVASQTLWHRTGISWWTWLTKRWRYVRELYFRDLPKRRWIMVREPHEYWGVLTFAIASVCVLPHLVFAFRGFRKLHDPAWFLHPVVCLALTVVYGAAWCLWQLRSRWSFPRSGGPTVSNAAYAV